MQKSGWRGVMEKGCRVAAAVMVTATLLSSNSMQAQSAANGSAAELGLMPLPSHLEAGNGRFTMRPEMHVAYTNFNNEHIEAGRGQKGQKGPGRPPEAD
jgi:hypothetical protein